jgi:hypothetical protein
MIGHLGFCSIIALQRAQIMDHRPAEPLQEVLLCPCCQDNISPQQGSSMNIHTIAEEIQRDLRDMPRKRIQKLPEGTELKFIQEFLHAWGYKLSEKNIQALAMRAESYDEFILSATK